MKHKWLWLTGIACWSVTARAEVSLPALFGDEMVLQRKTQAPIWGWANPGEAVTVTGSWGASAKTITHADGTWAVKLDTPEAGGPFALTVEGKNSIELKDVLSGEVWFCSGQSNMQLQVNECRDADREIAQATHPKIRLFQVKRVPSRDPLDDAEGTWETCSPESVPEPLIDQLKEGGRMIIPMGERYQQSFYLMKKEEKILLVFILKKSEKMDF